MIKDRKARQLVYFILWLLCFSLVNWPVGTLAQRFEPFVLGMPFSVFYFGSAYSLLIVVGIVIAWRVFRD